MTVNRQSQLFAAEDWKVAYQAFSRIDFEAYDFDTIRSALVEYMRVNYPENFNDYIESSEFIAIIELLAYLSQSLAFRMDLNTRENFLETAERRDSVFKLARMLGYNPKRNMPASGLMKITSIKTTESITDSLGTQLANRPIYWDDANNTQSYEQFITILNAAMSKTNRFTAPVKQGYIGGIETELYQVNSTLQSPVAYNTSINVNGVSKPINIVNPDFEDGSHFYERHPDPANLFNFIYRNDGKGLSSINTGFFTMFRQGQLQFRDFNYTTAIENRVEDIEVQNINEPDVYLQEVNANGLVLDKWAKIPNTVGQTLTYNSLELSTRNLYSIESMGLNGIRLRFSDGNFADMPVGIYRLWYRVSDPSRYTIQPQDARNVTLAIPYTDASGRSQTLTVTMSLQYPVSNSLPAESINAIKQRAPQVYYSQNRMVSAQDYNVFPQSQSTNITKLKAINRTHAGHSRYIDLNDPTGAYHNVDTFADDAYIYVETGVSSQNIVVNSTNTPLEVAGSVVPQVLKDLELNNFVYYTARDEWTDSTANGNEYAFSYSATDAVIWNPLPLKSTSTTGYFTENIDGTGTKVLVNNTSATAMLKENNLVKMVNPVDESEYKWVRITQVLYNGQLTAGVNTSLGPWTLSDNIDSGWRMTDVIVSMRKLFNLSELTQIETAIKDRRTFGLGYHQTDDRWYLINQLPTYEQDDLKYELDTNQEGAKSWLIRMDYLPIDNTSYQYRMTYRKQTYVAESLSDIKFYNIKDIKVVDSSNKSSQDLITISTMNTKPSSTETFSWTGLAWRNENISAEYIPAGVKVNLPLQTRDTTWEDVSTNWVSNFGIFSPVNNTVSETVQLNEYVSEAIVPLNVYKEVGAITTETNVVIATNSGTITNLPSKLVFQFNANTFGEDILMTESGDYYFLYRQVPEGASYGAEVIFKAVAGQPATSLGIDGLTPDSNTIGRINFVEYDDTTGIGLITYEELQNNVYHSSVDRTGEYSKDKLQVIYNNSKARLDDEIDWTIVDVYREPDGFIDPRKVKITPIDTDNDLVPDKPRQFVDYVGDTDIVLFENFNDYDGYTYARPVQGVVLDYRREVSVSVVNDRITPSVVTDYVELNTVDWILFRDMEAANVLAGNEFSIGIVVYVESEDKVYQVLPLSTDQTQISLVETQDYFVKTGRGKTQNTSADLIEDGIIRWQHVAPSDVRIDPSISNVIEMIVLTTAYNSQVNSWKTRQNTEFPLEPTSNQLASEFADLNTYKAASDSVVFRPAKFRLLFGNQADDAYRARFRVVKLSDQISDNELKSRIIEAIDSYFDVNNWEFGETFYFTELSSYIHQQLGSSIGSIVILPKTATGKFGELFQVKAEANELFISTATVSDIEIISRLDNQTLRIDR